MCSRLRMYCPKNTNCLVAYVSKMGIVPLKKWSRGTDYAPIWVVTLNYNAHKHSDQVGQYQKKISIWISDKMYGPLQLEMFQKYIFQVRHMGELSCCPHSPTRNTVYKPRLAEAAIGSFSRIQSSSSSTSRYNCCRRKASRSFCRRACIGSFKARNLSTSCTCFFLMLSASK